jgi:hypothetical protein
MSYLVLHDSVGIDDEQPSQGQVPSGDVNAVGLADFAALIARQGKAQAAQAALSARRRDPAIVGIERIRADPQYVAISLSDLG